MKRSVLVVDDYPDNRELLECLLSSFGYEVLTAADGYEAIAVARKELPAIIVMDIFMPGLDGIEATRRLKEDPHTASTPVIAYTARPAPVDEERHLFAGVCPKPCSPAQLMALVTNLIG